MKITPEHRQEFDELTEGLSDTVDELHEMGDPIVIGTMLFKIAEEKKSNNLVIRDINAKFDRILEKLGQIHEELSVFNKKLGTTEPTRTEISALSDRDEEILNFIRERGKVCADDVQTKFNYRGRNAASARLSRLFKDRLLKKEYRGRKVYYKMD